MIGRNDPCWCGSGKKYKKCHMPFDARGAERRRRRAPRLTPEEQEGVRRAGAFNGRLLDFLREHVRPGISTGELDRLAYTYIRDHGHTPACLGYRGYPKTLCISRNEVVCHGIPSDDEYLEEGDIVNIDATTIVDGFYGDSSETFLVGEVDPEKRRLVQVTAEAFLRGIAAVVPGRSIAAIAAAIQPYVESHGFSVVREFTGHGIGRIFHEHYSVFHHVGPETEELILEPGMCFTIEPMVNAGDWPTWIDPEDGWTARTRDAKPSAQFEHTILVTLEGPEILTLTPRQRAAGVPLIVDGIKIAIPPSLRFEPQR